MKFTAIGQILNCGSELQKGGRRAGAASNNEVRQEAAGPTTLQALHISDFS